MPSNGIPAPTNRRPCQPAEDHRAVVVPLAPLLLTAAEAATALAISERTLWDLTQPRGPIRVIRIGRAVRYSVEELRRWIDSQGSE